MPTRHPEASLVGAGCGRQKSTGQGCGTGQSFHSKRCGSDVGAEVGPGVGSQSPGRRRARYA